MAALGADGRNDVSWTDRYGPWALVVGAAHGIGAAFAHALAERGLRLILVDRDEAGLGALEAALTETETRRVVLDLAETDAPQRLLEAVGPAEVGLVVLNAAHSRIGDFTDLDLQDHLRTLQVNCHIPLTLAHHFGRAMKARGRGGLVLFSSVAGFQGTVRVSSYAASKAFSLVLGEALGAELAPAGVDVLVLAPGATRTPGYLGTNPQDESGPIMEPDEVVTEALHGLGRRRLVVPGLGNRAVRFLFGRILSRNQAVAVLARAMRTRYPAD